MASHCSCSAGVVGTGLGGEESGGDDESVSSTSPAGLPTGAEVGTRFAEAGGAMPSVPDEDLKGFPCDCVTKSGCGNDPLALLGMEAREPCAGAPAAGFFDFSNREPDRLSRTAVSSSPRAIGGGKSTGVFINAGDDGALKEQRPADTEEDVGICAPPPAATVADSKIAPVTGPTVVPGRE